VGLVACQMACIRPKRFQNYFSWSICSIRRFGCITSDFRNIEAFEGIDDFSYPIKQGRTTESEAIEACQAHAQATVNAAIEGCNVIPYRDPKGLVDLIRRWVELDDFSRTIPMGEELDLPEQQCPDNWGAISRESKSILKAWEDEK